MAKSASKYNETEQSISQILERLVAQSRPQSRTWLLLKVIAIDALAATEAWHAWLSRCDPETISPAEMRLLPAVAQKLERIGVKSGLPDMVRRARRETFIANQTRLIAVRPLLERLSSAMPVMVLKGGARIATDTAAAELRVIRDIDLLLRPEHLEGALEIAIATGYRSVGGRLPGPSKSTPLAPLYVAGKREPGYLEVDVHAAPLDFGRQGDFDQELWARAVDGELAGIPVKVPSAPDRFLHAAAHGLMADDDSPADWIIDSLVAVEHPGFDEQIVAGEVLRRRIGIPVAIAVNVLHDLGRKPSRAIQDACKADLSNPLLRWEFATAVRPHRSQTLVDKVIKLSSERYRTARARRRTTTWKTAWPARPSTKRPTTDWKPVTCGRADIQIHGNPGSLLKIWVSGIPRGPGIPRDLRRPIYDILLNGFWIGRAFVRPSKKAPMISPPSWRISMRFRKPLGQEIADPSCLTLVLLDGDKEPSSASGQSMAITAEWG